MPSENRIADPPPLYIQLQVTEISLNKNQFLHFLCINIPFSTSITYEEIVYYSDIAF